MKRIAGLVAILLVIALVLPASAQEVGPGEGSPIIYPSFSDPVTFNPLLSSDSNSGDVIARIFPAFIGIDPQTGVYVPGANGALAESWEVSEDGRTYTFTIRSDWTWSDGTPFSSTDIKYSYDAITSGEIDTPLASALISIESVEAPDAQTVVITYTNPTCTALNVAANILPVPSHVFLETIGTDYAAMNDSEFNLNPTVTADAFTFGNFRPAEQVTLVADQNYPDTFLDYVVPEGWIMRQLADQAVIVEEFLAGNLTLIDSVPEDRQAEIQALAAAGEVQYHEGPSATWQVLIFNVADPANPQNGVGEDEAAIDQGGHPILGDVRVRQAIRTATDHAALNEGAFAGTGIAPTGPVLPQSWAYPQDSQPWTFDQAAAAALLDEAGFVDDDNDPATPRVATEDALYAEPGTPLTFTITTFSGNPSVDASVVLMQDQLNQVGFDVQIEVIEFGTMVDKLLGQTFDSVMVFFGTDPQNPDEFTDLFTSVGDVIGSGFNAGSYANPRVTEILDTARTLPGCGDAERAALYGELHTILADEIPWFFVNVSVVPAVARLDLQNFAPTLYSFFWNIDGWTYQQEG